MYRVPADGADAQQTGRSAVLLDRPRHTYRLDLTCRSVDEVLLRTLMLATISQSPATLQAIHSEDIENSDRMRIHADLSTPGQNNEALEQIVTQLSLEPGVSSVSWSIVPTMLD